MSFLLNQNWLNLNENGDVKKTFIFRKDNNLLISTNGNVEKGKWEYLNNTTLLLELKEISLLLKHQFIDENILVLKIDGHEELMIFINESKFEKKINDTISLTSFIVNNYLKDLNVINSSIDKLELNNFEEYYVRSHFTFKMGKYIEINVKHIISNKTFVVFKKNSDNKYFIYQKSDILIFPNRETCFLYLIENYLN